MKKRFCVRAWGCPLLTRARKGEDGITHKGMLPSNHQKVDREKKILYHQRLNFMGLFELMRGAIILCISPILLIKALVLFGARIIGVAASAWIQVVKSFINFQADLLCKMVIWSMAFVSLPVRALTAVQRERMLEISMDDMRSQMENLIWENKEIEERLQRAVKDRKALEIVFAETEDDLDNALSKIEQLEIEVQELKDENLRLNEAHGKSLWNYKSQDEKDDEKQLHGVLHVVAKYTVPSWTFGFDDKGMIVHDHGDAWNERQKEKLQQQMKLDSAQDFSDSLLLNEDLSERRRSALSQSLFSALLSLLVGAIIWEAEDQCMPLVAALFIVVGMPLSSVVQFFSTIKNKPASDAVALLSFNWFILGTLTSPTVPRIAPVMAPLVLRLAGRALGWIGPDQ